VSRPTYLGGLGFGFKWNMGWMHDTLEYFSNDPIHRQYHHHHLTFGLLYAFSENFVLPLSHDEVVHGKGSLLGKMPGGRADKAANLRALLAWMWAHPGKNLLFMGGELAQSREWSHDRSLDWDLLQYPEHRGVQDLVRAVNTVSTATPALWQRDFEADGFAWIDANDSANNVISFSRFAADGTPFVCVANLSGIYRPQYRIGLPGGGRWRRLLDTQDPAFGGWGTAGGVEWDADPVAWHGLDQSLALDLSALSVVWLAPVTD
jgi:1,4-alpha-glucan branching enzyme